MVQRLQANQGRMGDLYYNITQLRLLLDELRAPEEREEEDIPLADQENEE
jgi:hypothetical protein